MKTGTEAPLDQRLDTLLAGDRAALVDPYSLYREVAETARVYEHGDLVLLTRHEDVRAAMRDNVCLSNKGQQEGSRVESVRAQLTGDERAAFDEAFEFGSNFLSRTDGDKHVRMRETVHRAFTPRKVAELEQSGRAYVDEFLTRMAGEEVVDVIEFAFRLPLMIVGELLGVPEEDRDMIHEWSADLGAASGSTSGPVMLRARDGVRSFRAYIADTVAHHRAGSNATDLMTVLLDAEGDDRLDDDELAGAFVQFLFAGHETTSTLIGAGLLALLRAPDQWRALVDDPSLVPNAVEELLRYVSPTQFSVRLVRDPVEFGGVTVEPGRVIFAIQAAANRDGSVFPDPDRVDVRRPEAKQHLAFGLGPHFCLGASLARLEGQIAFAELARRFPDLELVDDNVEWRGGPMLRSPVSVRVRPGRERR